MNDLERLNRDVRAAVNAYEAFILGEKIRMENLKKDLSELDGGVDDEAPTSNENVVDDNQGQVEGKTKQEKIGELLVELEEMRVARQGFGMELKSFITYALYQAYLSVKFDKMLRNLKLEFSAWVEKMEAESKLMQDALDEAMKMDEVLTEPQPKNQEEEDKDEHDEKEEEKSGQLSGEDFYFKKPLWLNKAMVDGLMRLSDIDDQQSDGGWLDEAK
ncbi:unnamed protein product [Orchesella dallaii]|uniref:Uncharacterized protein n=1 Tax=Orchesella dallaii TaxID=48710 RepID=A0ABP1S1E3_9HEXA